jgi:hypothetical protein
LQGILTNDSAGNSALTRWQVRNDLGDDCRMQLAVHSSGYSTLLFGQDVSNHVAIRGDGASNAGMVIGNVGTNAPIIFGINQSVVMRLLHTTPAAQSAANAAIGNGTVRAGTQLRSDGTAADAISTAGGMSVAGSAVVNAISSNSATINDDAVFSRAVGTGQLLLLTLTGAGTDQTAAVINCRAGATPYCVVVAGGSLVDATTGVLSGTTGTDNRVTVSTHTDGLLYIENRTGAARGMRLLVIGI